MPRRAILAALFIPFCLVLLHARSSETQKAAINFVRSLQAPDGGFLDQHPNAKSGATPGTTLRATLAAVRALKYLGGEIPDREKCKQFVASCLDRESGGFRDLPRGDKPNVVATAIGLMAVADLGMTGEPYQAAALKYLDQHAQTFDDIRIAAAALESIAAKSSKNDAWLREVEKLWNAQGVVETKRGSLARDTASVAVTALRLGGTLKNREAVVKALRDGQETSGGWSREGNGLADLETSYRVVRAFVMLKEQPEDVDALRNFIAKCHNNDSGYSLAPNEPSSAAGVYYAAIITHWLDGK